MRVAALLPAATDIVLALGAGSTLVAATHACTLPSRLGNLPRVTQSRVAVANAAAVDAEVTELSGAGAPLFELDDTALRSARPDVILTQAVCDVCAVREEDARAVASRITPPPRVVTLSASTVDGILDDVLTVADALGVDDGDELVMGLRSRMAVIHRKLKAARAPRPRVLVLEWTDPPFSAGHWVPDMVRRAGGIEVLGTSGEVSRRISPGEAGSATPDVVLVAPCGYALASAVGDAKALLTRDDWDWIRSKPLWAVNANALASTPSPGVVRGIEVLARVLHPTLFGAPSTADAILINP